MSLMMFMLFEVYCFLFKSPSCETLICRSHYYDCLSRKKINHRLLFFVLLTKTRDIWRKISIFAQICVLVIIETNIIRWITYLKILPYWFQA